MWRAEAPPNALITFASGASIEWRVPRQELCNLAGQGRRKRSWSRRVSWGGGRGRVQLYIDLNPQIVRSNKLFQVAAALPLLASPPLVLPLPLYSPSIPAVVLGNALHLPDAISQWATRAGTIVVYTNNLLRGGKMHHCLLCSWLCPCRFHPPPTSWLPNVPNFQPIVLPLVTCHRCQRRSTTWLTSTSTSTPAACSSPGKLPQLSRCCPLHYGCTCALPPPSPP